MIHTHYLFHVLDEIIKKTKKCSIIHWSSVGASQVKWNRVNRHVLATSHDGDIRIWDLRVSAKHGTELSDTNLEYNETLFVPYHRKATLL